MKEIDGRFFRPAISHDVRLTTDELIVDGIAIIQRISNERLTPFVICCHNAEAFADAYGDKFLKIATIAELMNKSNFVEAILKTLLFDWKISHSAKIDLMKAGFNQAEPRNSQGRWTDGLFADRSSLVDIKYNGKYHDQVVDDIMDQLRLAGSKVLKDVKISGFNAVVAIPDLVSKPVGAAPYLIEVKTGFDPKPTDNQALVYPLICVGGHATSSDPRIADLGLAPGVPFPPLDIWFVVKGGPTDNPIYFNYCDAIDIRRKFNVH